MADEEPPEQKERQGSTEEPPDKKKRPFFRWTKSDSEIFPSYTHLSLAYRVVCRQRYVKCIKDQQQQLMREITMHEELQPLALNGVRLHREFCDPILKKVSVRDMVRLTLEQDRRLEYIMKTDPKDL